MVHLHEHFFGFVNDAKYFAHNDEILALDTGQDLIGLAFYHFDPGIIDDLIRAAKLRSQRVVVYLKEPTGGSLFDLLSRYDRDATVRFFGDAVMPRHYSNWLPAISWFVSPRHYYQVDDWAKSLLARVDDAYTDNPFVFDCLLGITRDHRDTINRLYTDSHNRGKILYNYYRDNINNGIWNMDVSTVTGTWQSVRVHDEYEVALSALIPWYIYNQSHHSIVAETTTVNGLGHVTEKVAKPMMAKRVFVAFAGQHYLEGLRRLGFRTFHSIIDESYDLEASPQDRYRMAWSQVEYLCERPALEIKQQAQEILDHNHHHFLTTDWHQHVKDHLKSVT